MPAPKSKTEALDKTIERLRFDKSIAPKLRNRHVSVINRVCRLAGRPPAEVLADPAVIRKLLDDANWQIAGLKQNSWFTLKSNFGKALQAGGIKVLHRSRRNYKRTPKWDALLSQLSERGYRDMTRFAGWCSSHGLEPEDVTEAVFRRFLYTLMTESTQLHPKERWHLPRRTWNREVVPLSGGKAPFIPNVEPEGWKGLPWTAFPASLIAEIEEYKSAMTQPHGLMEGIHTLKPVTADGYTSLFRRQLSRLVDDGTPVSAFTSLAECLTIERIKRGLTLLLDGREVDDTTKPTISATIHAQLSLAQYAKLPEPTIKELRRLAKVFRYRPEDMHPRNERRLAKVNEPEALARFLLLPYDIASRLPVKGKPTVRQAQMMRHAATLELLLHNPLRIKNVALLDFEKHIQQVETDEGTVWRIIVPGSETKNGQQSAAELEPMATALLQRWRSDFRPVLQPKCSRVFIGQSGNGLLPATLSKSLHRLVKRELGLEVHAHLMRHFAATNYLDAFPGDFESVRQMLGHKQIETTIRAYCGQKRASAHRRYDEVIARMRDFSNLDFL